MMVNLLGRIFVDTSLVVDKCWSGTVILNGNIF